VAKLAGLCPDGGGLLRRDDLFARLAHREAEALIAHDNKQALAVLILKYDRAAAEYGSEMSDHLVGHVDRLATLAPFVVPDGDVLRADLRQQHLAVLLDDAPDSSFVLDTRAVALLEMPRGRQRNGNHVVVFEKDWFSKTDIIVRFRTGDDRTIYCRTPRALRTAFGAVAVPLTGDTVMRNAGFVSLTNPDGSFFRRVEGWHVPLA